MLAEAFGMSVYFYDTDDKQALGNARRCGSVAELLERSEVVSLHVDGRPGNESLFGEAQFAAIDVFPASRSGRAILSNRSCAVCPT